MLYGVVDRSQIFYVALALWDKASRSQRVISSQDLNAVSKLKRSISKSGHSLFSETGQHNRTLDVEPDVFDVKITFS